WEKPLRWFPLTVAATQADPGKPTMPAGTAITIDPRVSAFNNDRRSNTLLAGLVVPRLPWRAHMMPLLSHVPNASVVAAELTATRQARVRRRAGERGASDV